MKGEGKEWWSEGARGEEAARKNLGRWLSSPPLSLGSRGERSLRRKVKRFIGQKNEIPTKTSIGTGAAALLMVLTVAFVIWIAVSSPPAELPDIVPSVTTPRDVAAGDEFHVDEKTSDGAIVILNDRSIWLVDRIDRINSRLWLRRDKVVVRETKEKGSYDLINLDQKEKVRAKYLGEK